jgi:hypothetical protein
LPLCQINRTLLIWTEGLLDWVPLSKSPVSEFVIKSLPPPIPTIANPHSHQRPKTSWLKTEIKGPPIWVYIVILITGLFLFFGNFHVVNGSNVGFKIIKRDSFGFSEIFINVDVITGMPWIAAKSRYPLSCRALARERLIESDEEFENRTQKELNDKLDKITKETQTEISKSLVNKNANSNTYSSELPIVGPNELDTSGKCIPDSQSNCECDSIAIILKVVKGLHHNGSELDFLDASEGYVTLDDGGKEYEYHMVLLSLNAVSRAALSLYFVPGNKLKIRRSYCGSSGFASIVYVAPSN